MHVRNSLPAKQALLVELLFNSHPPPSIHLPRPHTATHLESISCLLEAVLLLLSCPALCQLVEAGPHTIKQCVDVATLVLIKGQLLATKQHLRHLIWVCVLVCLRVQVCGGV